MPAEVSLHHKSARIPCLDKWNSIDSSMRSALQHNTWTELRPCIKIWQALPIRGTANAWSDRKITESSIPSTSLPTIDRNKIIQKKKRRKNLLKYFFRPKYIHMIHRQQNKPRVIRLKSGYSAGSSARGVLIIINQHQRGQDTMKLQTSDHKKWVFTD